ncbi:hypothetical protein N6H14_26730 [Paenibacillus sp. CC-CFT747]|nr:hypothetical protein N6H14_26730 [Paenibacillus sp. CC-CFT747]
MMYGKGKQALLFDFGVEHSSLLFPTQVTLYEPVNATPGRELRQFLLGGMTAPLLELYDPDQRKGLDGASVLRAWGEPSSPNMSKFISTSGICIPIIWRCFLLPIRIFRCT